MRDWESENELELFNSIVCAIRDSDWDSLSMARNVLPDIEDFCGEFLARMLFGASVEHDHVMIYLVQARIKEYLEWILKGKCICDV